MTTKEKLQENAKLAIRLCQAHRAQTSGECPSQHRNHKINRRGSIQTFPGNKSNMHVDEDIFRG